MASGMIAGEADGEIERASQQCVVLDLTRGQPAANGGDMTWATTAGMRSLRAVGTPPRAAKVERTRTSTSRLACQDLSVISGVLRRTASTMPFPSG